MNQVANPTYKPLLPLKTTPEKVGNLSVSNPKDINPK
jgi:hypothetical protein